VVVGFSVFNRRAFDGRLQRFVISVLAVQRPWRLAAQHDLVDAEEQRATDETAIEIRLEIARSVQLIVKP
jgi:hypothetical protein